MTIPADLMAFYGAMDRLSQLPSPRLALGVLCPPVPPLGASQSASLPDCTNVPPRQDSRVCILLRPNPLAIPNSQTSFDATVAEVDLPT